MESSIPHVNLKAFFSRLCPPSGQEYLLWAWEPEGKTPIALAVYSSKEEGEKAMLALLELSHYQGIHLTSMGAPLLHDSEESNTNEIGKSLDGGVQTLTGGEQVQANQEEPSKLEQIKPPSQSFKEEGKRILLPPRRGAHSRAHV
jgi:hypothetical protein